MYSMARDPRRRADPDPVAAVMAAAAATVPVLENSKMTGNGRKPPLPTDICWRCRKPRHQKGQPCKVQRQSAETVESKDTMRKCMKKPTHLAGIPDSSSNSDPDYFDEYGEPVYV